MPEGDTIFRVARTLHRELAGRMITRFESDFPSLNRVDVDHPLAGRTIESVTSLGKHLLMRFSGDLVLHTHMKMSGVWRLSAAGGLPRRDPRARRIVIATAEAVAIGIDIPVAELLTTRELARHKALVALGPDLLDDRFDPDEAARRMRAQGRERIGDVLLNQRVVAGVGNVFRSEILFVAGVNPLLPVAEVADDDLRRIIETARTLLAANVMDRKRMLTTTVGRRTTRSLDPSVKLWVYGRVGKPCRQCGAPIAAHARGTDARVTYWCPTCQSRSTSWASR
jgi:endonuclease-8